MEHDGIAFVALFGKATTTIDGGWTVTFQLSQDEAQKVLQLSQFRESLLQVAVIPMEHSEKDPFSFKKKF